MFIRFSNASHVCPHDLELRAGCQAGQWPLMVNEQLTEWTAETFFIILVTELPFLCFSSGPQEAQAEQWSPKADRELGAATRSPEPEHWQVLAAASGEAGVCNTVTAGVAAESPLQSLTPHLYHLIPLNSARRSQALLPFQISAGFPLLFSPSWERCALVTPFRCQGFLVVLECWEALGQPCCS